MSDYLVRPPVGAGPWPGVVLLHELFGMNDAVRRLSDRLAGLGYLVLAPDLFEKGLARCLVTAFMAFRQGHGETFDLIEAARARLAADPACTGRVWVIGFCMGGSFALLAAPRGFDACCSFYGALPTGPDVLANACPVMASYGGRDSSLVGAAEKLEKALTAYGIDHDIHVYPDAGHSFMNDEQVAPLFLRLVTPGMHAAPEPASAEHAWGRIEAFFGEHLR